MPKIFVLSCDGAPLHLVERWANQGRLPAFKRLLDSGARGELESVYPPITGPAWTSFLTGRNPGKHGIGDWYVRATDSYRLRPVDSTSIRTSTIWDECREGGKRTISLGLPMNYPPPKVNGVVVSGLETPGTRCAAYPPELAEEIPRAVPGFRTHLREVFRPGREERALEDLLEITDVQNRVALHLLDRTGWDLMLLHHQSSDWAMHFFWHAMDPEHPRHTSEAHDAAGDAILRVFQEIDSGLARLLDRLDDDTNVVVISDHGFGILDKYLFLNNWLLDAGLLNLRSNLSTRWQYGLFKRGFTPANLYRAAERLGVNKFAFRMGKASRVSLLTRAFLSQENIDWASTKAYSVGNIGQVFVNLKGREPQGVVAPGAEYEAVRDRVIEGALAIEDPETGEKAIERAYRKEEIYSGPYVNELPDVLLLPRDLRYQAGGLSQFMSNRLMEPSFAYTGGHRMNGLLIMRGSGIEPGSIEGARLMDLAPTLLHMLSLPVPTDMDGIVLPVARAAADEVAHRSDAASHEEGGGGYSAEEEREIAERLKSLGYVE